MTQSNDSAGLMQKADRALLTTENTEEAENERKNRINPLFNSVPSVSSVVNPSKPR